MSLVSTIRAAVEAAFKAADDKVVVGTLGSNLVSGFNFSTGTVTSTSASRSVELIEFQVDIAKDEHPKKQVVIRAVDFDLSLYSTLTYSNQLHYIEAIEAYEGAVLLTLRGV